MPFEFLYSKRQRQERKNFCKMLANCVKIRWDTENINGVYIKAAENESYF